MLSWLNRGYGQCRGCLWQLQKVLQDAQRDFSLLFSYISKMMSQKDIDKKGRDMPDFSKYANSNEKTKGSHKSVNAKILAKGYTKGLYRSERFL